MKEGPFVSIIIPVFNGEKYLDDCINSSLSQTWPLKEIIIVNDGSSDATLNIAKRYEKKGVIVLSQENKGASTARNLGLKHANGEYIQFLDADDLLHRRKLEAQIGSLERKVGKIAVCNTAHFINGKNHLNDNISDDGHFFSQYLHDPLKFLVNLYGGFDLRGGMIQPNAFLTHRSIVEKAGLWNEKLKLDDDGEFFCRIILNSDGIVYSNEVMNYYRKFKQTISLSSSNSETAYESSFLSALLKHEHLLRYCSDKQLIPFIHTATYRMLWELKLKVYPCYMNLYREVNRVLKTLKPNLVSKKHVFGGHASNFIGNRISWKLIRRLQHYVHKQSRAN